MEGSHLLATDSIIESAAIATGVTGQIDDALRERVDILAGYFRERGPYTVDQMIATRRQLVKLLARRLSIMNDIARHPEILDEKIENPIFVVGFARTGTSLLQALLAADPANRGMVAWQTREPSPPPGQQPLGPSRLTTAAQEVARFVDRCPGINVLHPYWDAGADTLIEDEEIFSLDFLNAYPTLLYDSPTLAILTPEDYEVAYRFLRQFMQHQQWRLPKHRWVMKGVEHQWQLPALLRVFPDAKCLFAHREPKDFLLSTLAIAAVVYDSITSGQLNRLSLGSSLYADLKQRLEHMATDLTVNDDRVYHIAFPELVADPVAAIRRCYEAWGFVYSDAAETAMRTWLDDDRNRGDRYGRQDYQFAAYGVNWAAESPAFDPYRQRFLGLSGTLASSNTP